MDTIIDNRLEKLFQQRSGDILSVYFTAGYPQINDTMPILEALEKAGADMVEVGIPFSDPTADGPTIQQSSEAALRNGMTLKLLFQQLEKLREKITIPVIFMGYFNPILQYGLEKFCQDCERIGVDGLIIPDLPMDEYIHDYKTIFNSYGLLNTFLISPQTQENRIRTIDENTKGFIYMVSSASTTGAKTGISEQQIAYFERIKNMKLQNPLMIGFGISNRDTFQIACDHANGAIIGSAFIKMLADSKNLEHDIETFVNSIKGK